MIRIDTDFRLKNTDSPHEIVACLKLPRWQSHDAATFDLGVHPPLKLVTRRTRDGNGALLWMRSLHIKIYIT